MAFVFDTNIVSTFAKVNKLELLAKLFGKEEMLIPKGVVNDLVNSNLELSVIINSNVFRVTELANEEHILVRDYSDIKSLGQGELECIAICKNRDNIFITNDYRAIKFAESLSIKVIDLKTLLISLREILNTEELRKLMIDIETKDKVLILDKEKILENNELVK